MRTPEQWVEWLLAEHGTGTPPDVLYLTPELLADVIRQAQAEAAKPSLPDVPPGVLLDGRRLSNVLECLRQWKMSPPYAAAAQVTEWLLRDREALLRLLHDSEGLDAYQKGWAAGLDAGQRQALHDARERLSRAELSESRRQLVAATLRLFDVMLEELDRA